MRTITKKYKVYSFSELSEESKEKAYSDWLYNNSGYPWGNDNAATLHKFCDMFDIEVTNWSYDSNRYDYHLEMKVDNGIAELKGIRMYKYIMNNFYLLLSDPKTYEIKRNDKTLTRKSRISRTFGLGYCELTGFCMDYDILRPLFDFLNTRWNSLAAETTYEDLMHECVSSFFRACKSDCEYCESEEYFKEQCECNDWEFLENGTLN